MGNKKAELTEIKKKCRMQICKKKMKNESDTRFNQFIETN